MSLYGAVMIIFIMILRRFALYKLPKKTFKILWIMAVCRLLIPFWLSVNIGDFFGNAVTGERTGGYNFDFENLYTLTVNRGNAAFDNMKQNVDIIGVIWVFGCVVTALYFGAAGWFTVKKLSSSGQICCNEISGFIGSFHVKRSIEVKVCKNISSPLTVGIFKPKIYFPESISDYGTGQARVILSHEMIHIKNYDMLLKLIMTAALCIHWFDPFVWVMFELFNRDIELSCDEELLNRCGVDKEFYAMTLINFKERQFVSPFTNNFAKNSIKERIRAIMKSKNKTNRTVFVSTGILCAAMLAFGAKVYSGDSNAADISSDFAVKVESESEKQNSDKNEIADIDESANIDDSGDADVVLPSKIDSLPQNEYINGNEAKKLLRDFFDENYSYPLDETAEDIMYYGAFEIKADEGENIYSMSDGIVLYSDYDYRFGNALIIDHGNDNVFLYASCNDLTVEAGDSVSSGELIGHIGESGFTPEPRLLVYKLEE